MECTDRFVVLGILRTRAAPTEGRTATLLPQEDPGESSPRHWRPRLRPQSHLRNRLRVAAAGHRAWLWAMRSAHSPLTTTTLHALWKETLPSSLSRPHGLRAPLSRAGGTVPAPGVAARTASLRPARGGHRRLGEFDPRRSRHSTRGLRTVESAGRGLSTLLGSLPTLRPARWGIASR